MSGAKVLIVDDDESICLLVTRVCEQEGYQVRAADGAEAAYRILDEGPIDVGIVDLFLPEPSGLKVLQRAKTMYPDCQVIILSGHSDLQTVIEAMRLSAADYLVKPILDLALIPLSIKRSLERQGMGRRNALLFSELQQLNQELESRRRSEIETIRSIGQALASALDAQDMAQLLTETMLGSTACDAAGLLLLPSNIEDDPVVVVRSRIRLSASSEEALIRAAVAHLPPQLRPDLARVRIVASCADAQGMDAAHWDHPHGDVLAVRETVLGVSLLARHGPEPFGDEDLSIFQALVSQVSIALENAHLFARMRELATRDRLTGLYNHGHFFDMLTAEASRSERHGQKLTIIMVDVDRTGGLKDINATYGHQGGDRLLAGLADLLRDSVRRADVVARYGGDEFIILAPQTNAEQGMALAERIRDIVHKTPFVFGDVQEYVTVSVGVGVLEPGWGEAESEVVGRADRALYLAKELGGNQVCLGPRLAEETMQVESP